MRKFPECPSRERTAVWIDVVADVAGGGRILAALHVKERLACREAVSAATGPVEICILEPIMGTVRVGALDVRLAAGPRVGFYPPPDVPRWARHGAGEAADVATILGRHNNRLRSK